MNKAELHRQLVTNSFEMLTRLQIQVTPLNKDCNLTSVNYIQSIHASLSQILKRQSILQIY